MSAPALDVDSTRQAGGGASSLMQATPTLNSTSLGYLKEIFNSHAGPDEQWSAGQIQRFITQVQQNDETTEAAKHLLAKGAVDFSSFLQYMTSQDSALTLPWKECDLSWPLSSYFISSSHNTYLSGNQLSSASTTEAYTNVLKRGCRCVEVDVWDGQEGEGDNSSLSSASSEEGGKNPAKPGMLKRQGTFNKIKSKFPNSLTSRFEKSGIGKRIEQRVSGGHHESKPATAPAVEKPVANTVSASSAAEAERQHPLEVGVVEPRVLHGYTLTKEISFRDVCNAIRESAFAVTDLPLIISLEVHCDRDQQLMMTNIMKEAWAGMLVTEDEVKTGTLPSPNDLKRKILIKVKYAPPETPSAAAARKSLEERESVDADSDDDDRMPEEAAAAAAKKKSKIRQELSKMGIYTQAVSFKAWTQPEASMPTHIFSLSEKKYLEHRDKQPQELFQHNRDYLLRAYPSGLRIRSSNLMPTTFWGTGAQIVALNWQQNDDGMMLNEGMFAGTGGYVLKPEGYRSKSDPRSTPNSAISKYKLNLTITCLAAQSIPLPKGDTSPKKFHPYVKAELHVDASDSHATGRPDSSDSHDHEVRHKSRTKTHQGCDVDLGGQKLTFTEISGLVEELTFVRFVIRDDELGVDDLAAWACVRLDRLGQGYRFIHLLDSKGNLTEGNILVKVEKELREESGSDEGRCFECCFECWSLESASATTSKYTNVIAPHLSTMQ